MIVWPLLGMSCGLKIFLIGGLFQGRFSINLYGTGLSLAESARWISQGNYAVSDIKKSPVRLPMGWRMGFVFSFFLSPSPWGSDAKGAGCAFPLSQTILQSVREKIEDGNQSSACTDDWSIESYFPSGEFFPVWTCEALVWLKGCLGRKQKQSAASAKCVAQTTHSVN